MLGKERNYVVLLTETNLINPDLVGERGKIFQKLYELDVKLPQSVIITTDSFDDFLSSNDLVHEINQMLSSLDWSNHKKLVKFSTDVDNLFRQSVIPPSIFDQFHELFLSLSGNGKRVVGISPSWPSNIHGMSEIIDKKYTFTNISTVEEFEKAVKNAWLAIFDPDLVKKRFENQFMGNLSMALIVSRMINSEASGKAYNKNLVTGDINETEINAVLGLEKGISELGISFDRYVVSKSDSRIIEKNTMAQSKMLIRKSIIKKGESHEMAVDVSKIWQISQKISDLNIKEIASLTEEVSKILPSQNIELDWAIDMGRINITGLRVLADNSTKSTVEQKVLNKSEKVLNNIQEDKTEDLDEYVHEIEKEIEELSGEISSDPEKVGISKKTDNIAKQYGVLKSIKYSPQKQRNSITSEIWLNAEKFPKYELDSNLFDGIFGIFGEKLVKGFDQVIDTKSSETSFREYAIDELMSFVTQDLSKKVMYSPSILNLEEGQKYLGISDQGNSLHIANSKIFMSEIDALKDVRNVHGYRKLSVMLRNIETERQLKDLKTLVTTVGLRRSSTFEINMFVDEIPLFMRAKDYLSESVDKIFLDLDKILGALFGKTADLESVLNKELFWDAFKSLCKEAINNKVSVISYSTSLNSSPIFVEKLMKFGITSFGFPAKKLEDGRKLIGEIELKILG